jgi:hypothetical protein
MKTSQKSSRELEYWRHNKHFSLSLFKVSIVFDICVDDTEAYMMRPGTSFTVTPHV